VFISADYRLLPSATVHDIIDDIKDLFSFLSQEDLCFKTDAGDFGVDPTSLAVAGSSAGGTCAYLAAIHASPKPKAVLGLYAAGGNFFVCLHTSHRALLITEPAPALPNSENQSLLPWTGTPGPRKFCRTSLP